MLPVPLNEVRQDYWCHRHPPFGVVRDGSDHVGSHELVERDGKVADSFSGGVEDGVGDRGGHADDDEFAQSLDADRVGLLIRGRKERRVQFGDVGVDRTR